jgi:hypothetical protein
VKAEKIGVPPNCRRRRSTTKRREPISPWKTGKRIALGEKKLFVSEVRKNKRVKKEKKMSKMPALH